jgi:hypothetical protein
MPTVPGIRLAVVLAAVAVVLLAAASPASARSFVLRATGSTTGPGVVQQIGDFRPPSGATLRRAVRAYGVTTSRRGGGEICRVRWAGLGALIIFQNFGGSDSCGPRGLAQKAVLTGDRPWRTEAGLRIGDGVARLRRLHPGAKRTPRGFRLVEAVLPFGTPVSYAVLGARVKGGRVTAFTMFVGAAGD